MLLLVVLHLAVEVLLLPRLLPPPPAAAVHRCYRRCPCHSIVLTSPGANDRTLAWGRGRGCAGAATQASLPQRQGLGHQPSRGSRLRGGLQRGVLVRFLDRI